MIVDFLIVLNMVLLTLIVIKCILAILTIDVMLLIYLSRDCPTSPLCTRSVAKALRP